MESIQLPILIVEGFDIGVFPSIKEAEKFLEPWWVLQKRGKVYDSKGKLLQLEVDNRKVRIIYEIPKSDTTDEFRDSLIGYLMRVNQNEDESSLKMLSLEALVYKVIDRDSSEINKNK